MPLYRSGRFLEDTLAGITGAIEDALVAEEIAGQHGWLQRLDPRAKLVGALALLLATGLAHHLWLLGVLYLLTIPAALSSAIPPGLYLKRVWVLMPFFTGVIALPALFNVFSPGPPVLTLLDLAEPRIYLAITEPGLRSAAFLVLRVATSVSIGLLLILTTRWAALLRALRVLRLPPVFVMLLGMTYRYIFLLLHIANNMFLARKSRTVGRVSPAENRHWVAATAGSLLARSYDMSNEVYLAMQSRGFRGEARVLESFAWSTRDSLWTLAFLAVALVAIVMGR